MAASDVDSADLLAGLAFNDRPRPTVSDCERAAQLIRRWPADRLLVGANTRTTILFARRRVQERPEGWGLKPPETMPDADTTVLLTAPILEVAAGSLEDCPDEFPDGSKGIAYGQVGARKLNPHKRIGREEAQKAQD